MRLHTKRVLYRAIIVLPVLFVVMWGIVKTIDSGNDSRAVACNANATSIADAVCLQDMNDSVRASMEVEVQYALVDSRDGKTYNFSRLRDGNVWMTQNLSLGNTSTPISLTPDDTDISLGSTFTELPVASSLDEEDDYFTVESGFIEGGSVYIMTSGSWARDIIRYSGSSHYRLGNGYPWTVATAQTASYVDVDNPVGIDPNPIDSICPAGWKLPSQDDYAGLLEEYELLIDSGGTEEGERVSSALRGTPFHFVRGFPYTIGTEGHYWTSDTVLTENGVKGDASPFVAKVFYLDGYGGGPNTKQDSISGVADAVRCVARPDSSFVHTLSYDMNGGNGSIEGVSVNSNRKYASAMVTNTEPTRANHMFKGWAKSLTATVASYNGGDEIAFAGEQPLYAVWEVVISDQVVSFEEPSVTKTFGDSDFTNAATTTGNGAITYSIDNTSVAEINANTGKVTIKGTGTAVITASAAATDYYRAASATYNLTVSKATPTVSFENTEVSKSYLDEKFVNAATTTGDGTIAYSSNNTAVATVDSATGEVTINGVGTATITASVGATDNYNSASATYALTVGRYAPTITFTNTAVEKIYGDEKFINAATTISDGVITYGSSNTAVATVDSATGEVTIVSVGSATITASVPATANYDEAMAAYSLTVGKKTSVAPAEISEIKHGYVTDSLSTIVLTTPGLVWSDGSVIITEGNKGYAVNYTENADTDNYTTESFEITVNGERRSYEVLEGDGQKYVEDMDILRFSIGANYSLFENGGEVYIDGALIGAEYYTAEANEENIIINISKEYLEQLLVDDHELSIFFNDGGVAMATFTVEEEKKDDEQKDDEQKDDEQKDDEKKDDEQKDDEKDEEFLPVPDTGALSDGNSNGANMLICLLPGIMVAGALIGKYLVRVKIVSDKFKW